MASPSLTCGQPPYSGKRYTDGFATVSEPGRKPPALLGRRPLRLLAWRGLVTSWRPKAPRKSCAGGPGARRRQRVERCDRRRRGERVVSGVGRTRLRLVPERTQPAAAPLPSGRAGPFGAEARGPGPAPLKREGRRLFQSPGLGVGRPGLYLHVIEPANP